VQVDGGAADANGGACVPQGGPSGAGGRASGASGGGSAEGGEGCAPNVGVSGAAGGGDASADLYVHVAGAVQRPGLIRVAAGARVATALERVGGPTRRADLTLVNLAAELQDGQQIVVPLAGAPAGAGGGSPASGAAPGGVMPAAKIHLSTATAEQLDEIDGIGPTLAERIIEYRDAHGGFRSIDELSEVDGIGEKRLTTLRDALQP
jgi:competence protein ComEA